MPRVPVETVISKLPPNVTLDVNTYVGVNKKARFIDSVYGEWWTIPASVILGFRHPNYRKEEYAKKYALPIENIMSKLPPQVTLDQSTYKNAKVKARFIDSEYGEWWARPSVVLKGYGRHPKYGKQCTANALSTGLEEIISKLPPFVKMDESTYTKSTTKARFIDSEYGEWWVRPITLLKTKSIGHPKRGIIRRSNSQSLPLLELISRIPDYLIIDESTYKNTSTKARFIDSIYGELWIKPQRILQGANHPKRSITNQSKKQALPLLQLKSRLPSYITIDESTYINANTKARFIDSEYGEWLATPHNVLQGTNHPKRYGSISKGECKLFSYIKELDSILEQSSRILRTGKTGYEIDIYLPEKKLGIEYHGLYWHSENRKDKTYHQDKLRACSEKGINLLQIYSDEWLFKQDIVKSIIKAKLGVSDFKYYARKLEMKDVDNKEAQEFLKTNHLMGEFRSAKHIGLYAQDQLVSLISYKKHKEGVDISRFCNALNSSVAGGLSKLLKEIERRENPKFIQSWVDLRYGTGDSLKAIGFQHKRTTLGWKWTDGHHTFNRLKCRANMDSRRLTEKQHSEELGWYRIYDAGQALYIKTVDK